MNKPAAHAKSNHARKAYIITGGASGIGLSLARQLGRAGANLTLWDINAEALTRAGGELNTHHRVLDITRPEQVQNAFVEAKDRHGDISGVIHCAGLLRVGLFESVDLETYRRILVVNSFGTAVVAHAALPYLRATRGSLILMSSVSAFHGVPDYAVYGASKAAVLNFAQAIRVELAGSGVHVGVVAPGTVDTPMVDQEARQRKMVRRFGIPHTPDQIATCIVRGIERRQTLILPDRNIRFQFWLSRVTSPRLGHLIMRWFWR